MCVIIVREAGKVIPAEMIKSACEVNPHGFGISVADRGIVETFKHFDPKGNDPDLVMKMLEEAKDQKLMLHLRFATIGGKSKDASHPFPILEKGVDTIDVDFCHNGTLSEFNSKDNMPDSYYFATKVVTPMMQLIDKQPEPWYTNELLNRILSKYAGGSSVFSLIDGDGNTLIINKNGNGGKDWDWGYSSNTYSFNRYHRTGGVSSYTSRPTSYGTKTSGTTTNNFPQKTGESTTNNAMVPYQRPAVTAVSNIAPVTLDMTASIPEGMRPSIDAIKTFLKAKGAETVASKEISADLWDFVTDDLPLFHELIELDSVDSLLCLDSNEVRELIVTHPDAMTYLFMNLLWEVWTANLSKPKETKIVSVTDAEEVEEKAA